MDKTTDLTPKQEDYFLEAGMEDLREHPDRDETVYADEPTDEDIGMMFDEFGTKKLTNEDFEKMFDKISLENRDLDIRVTRLEKEERK